MRSLLSRALTTVVAIACAGTLGAAAVMGSARPHAAVPAASQAIPVDDPAFADLRSLILALGGSEADAKQLADLAVVPGNAEFFNPVAGAAVANPPPQIDPVLTVTAELNIPDIVTLTAPGGPLAAGNGPLGSVAYGEGLTTPADSEMYILGQVFKEPCGPRSSTQEYGAVAYDTTPLNGGDPGRWLPPTTLDLFYGANTAYVLSANADEDYAAARFQLSPPSAPQRWGTTESNWMAMCVGRTVVGLIPSDEWSGITDIRLFATDVPVVNGQEDIEHASQMRYPAIADDPIMVLADQPPIVIGPEATVAPTQSPAPTARPTAAPTAVVTPTPTLPYFPPPHLPSFITPDYLIYLLGVGGLALVGLAIGIWIIADRRSWMGVAKDCLPLLDAWRRAKEACDAAQQAADAAWQRYIEASKAARAAEAAERAAQDALKKAESDLAAAEARAKGEPSGWVEGDPYGKITTDDLALQREANAAARAEADAAKQAALDAWHAAGSPQGDAWAKVDDQLSAIEQGAQAQMARNNDPANLPGLRKAAAAKAKAQIDGLKAAVDAARKTLADASAAKLNAQETESVVGNEAKLAKEQADKDCAAADAARRAYEECVGAAQAAAKAKAQSTPPPPPPPPGGKTGPGGVIVGPGGGNGPGQPKSTPPERPCKDGDEEWRAEGEARSFSVRADGPRTRVQLWTDPEIKGLVAWTSESPSADKRESGEEHPSVSVVELDNIGPRLNEWLRGLGGSQGLAAPNMDLHFSIKVKSRTVQCERRLGVPRQRVATS